MKYLKHNLLLVITIITSRITTAQIQIDTMELWNINLSIYLQCYKNQYLKEINNQLDYKIVYDALCKKIELEDDGNEFGKFIFHVSPSIHGLVCEEEVRAIYKKGVKDDLAYIRKYDGEFKDQFSQSAISNLNIYANGITIGQEYWYCSPFIVFTKNFWFAILPYMPILYNSIISENRVNLQPTIKGAGEYYIPIEDIEMLRQNYLKLKKNPQFEVEIKMLERIFYEINHNDCSLIFY